MKTVALLTDAYAADPSYSINIVCEEILGMLSRAGYSPIAIAEDIFEPVRNWTLAEMRTIPSGIPRGNSITFHDDWQKDVRRIKESLDVALEGVDVVITHDMIYQASALWVNLAARWYARENPGVTWLNWVHSATESPVWTSKDQRLIIAQSHMPNSLTVYPNDQDRLRVASSFHCELDDVAVVPHSTDIFTFLGISAKVRQFAEDTRLLSADVILVYPIRLDRGKQVEHVIRLAAALKGMDKDARVIVVDFHSTGGDKVTYRQELQSLAIDLGLASHECTFTSQVDDEWKVSVPREVVRDLFLLSNVYLHPSVSETYSLTTQEAATCGNFLLLNRDFPPMRDIYGPHAAYYQFSGAVGFDGLHGEIATTYEDIDAYFHDIALRVVYELDTNHVLAQTTRIRQTRNPDYIFKRYIEPLFSAFSGVS